MDPIKYHEFMPKDLPGLLPDASFWTVVALVLVGVSCFFWQPKHHPQEPFVIPQGIPFIGHFVGIFKHGFGYYQFIHNQFRLPIFTLNFMSSKLHVVTSLETLRAVSKTKTISLTPFIYAWLPVLYGLDREAKAVLKKNMNCEEGKFGYMHDSYAIHHELLSPDQETLAKLNEKALNGLADIINHTHSVSADLSGWVRHSFTVFSTNAMYGHRNPIIASPRNETDFWLIEEKFHLLLLDLLPKITTRGAYRARENVTSAFCDYYKDGIPADASELVRERTAVGRKYSLTTDALARLDVGLAQAIVTNTVPLTIRSEVEALFNNGRADPSKIRGSCPVLSSTWQEALRFHSFIVQGRMATEDTMVEDRFLITKGATVIIPPSIIHGDTDSWGPDAAVFDPHRFMPDRKKAPYGAFRAFGGGTIICPGRHFAANMVVTFVATMVAGFDIVPQDGKALTVPERDMFRPSLGVLKPAEGREVRIERREGWENVVWSFSKDTVDASEVQEALGVGK